MKRSVALRACACLAWILGLGAGMAFGQTDVEINGAVQFNFVSPGARSLALGGAFVGLADDATAAFTNPAGLTTLSKPEVSVEGRGFRYSHLFTNAGRLGGNPTRVGVDTLNELVNAEAKNDVAGLSFASIVYPHGSWALAAYRHEVANFQADLETQGAFYFDSRIRPARADMDLDVVNYGLSAAARLGDALSLGVGVSLYDFKLASTTSRFDFVNNGTGPGGFFGPPLASDSNVINFQTQEGDDTGVGVNAGLTFKLGEKARLGAVYRQGPDFDFEVRNVGGPRAAQPNRVFAAKTARFHVPDAYGMGLSVHPTDSFTVSVDYQRVAYSQLTDGFVTIFEGSDPANYSAEDANEFHLGLEYVFAGGRNPVAIRVGAWNDPDHKVVFVGPASADPDAALFRAGEDELHVSGGFGVVLGGNFQLDAAVDVSSRITIGSLSAVVRF